MAAKDFVLRRRNANDDGYEEVLVPVTAMQRLGFSINKEPTAGNSSLGYAGTALATAGAGTITAALIIGGLVLRDPNGSSRTDTTDTAANIIAAANAIGQLTRDYEEIFFYYINTADAAETITLAGGVGVTLQGIGTIAQNSMDRFCLFRTSGTTLVMRKA